MTSESERPVRWTVTGRSATVTLDSPANRNALSAALVAGVLDGLAAAETDDDARFVVLTHTGGTFCAGADLAEAAREGGPAQGTDRLVGLLRRMITFPKPIVAVVDGHVRAGGMGLLGASDVVIAGPACTFALTEARLGLAPAIISLTLADRLDPRAWARYALGGETFDAAEGARIGLVTVATDDVEAALVEVGAAYAEASPQGLRATKELVNARLVETFDAQAAALAGRSAELFASDEAQEGIAAFRARRPPRWARR